ncbi:MAG: Coenzyme F420 hydrogenase/dehydrogenase, beta subunit C-terminal domain [candidate division KSB1 bacterium]|nr:Coenzyme F420 hydrogenase/dehydrogenase, beta subunit C-terminal domain [candidate division KSB1 bacterium]
MHIDRNILSISFTNTDLCTRCGTCIGVCPTQALSEDENRFPKIDEQACIECGLCSKTCPGGSVPYRDLTRITFGHEQMTDHFDGHVQKTFVGYAENKAIRKGAAGGGVITGLMWHLLKSGQVDGCIVCRMNPGRPWEGEVFVARTLDELLQSQQSKYIVIPVNEVLQTLKSLEGQYAIAALPCQIHGLRLAEEKAPKTVSKISVLIGLFCASSLEPRVTDEMLRSKGIDKNDIKWFEYRGGDWPGKIRATLKNDTIRPLHYSNFKDGAINYLTYLYSPPRCQTCVDGSSEFADISVSDAWTRNARGRYLYKAQSRLLARTDRGVQVMQSAESAGDLLIQDVSEDQNYQTHKLHARKKGVTAYIRVHRLRKKGTPVPEYDRTVTDVSSQQERIERMESFIMRLARRTSSLRFALWSFLTSRYGVFIIKLRQWRKARKYRPPQ